MRKVFLLWLLQLAVLAGLYYLALRGRIAPPADWLGALGGGFGLLLAIGAFRNAWSARKGRALLDRALTGAPYEDGQRIAAVGPILALGAPIPAPFSAEPCVFCAWDVSHESPRAGRSKPQSVKDFSGFVMTPCVVQAPTGNVRILGFPVLEGFPEDAQRNKGDFLRAQDYLQSAPFEKMNALKAFSEIEDLVADEEGRIRKDWRLADDDFQLDPDLHTFTEQIVKDGETVCAFGLYSAEKKGISAGIKLIRGDSESAGKTLKINLWKYSVVGVLLFLVTHVLLFNLAADPGVSLKAEKRSARQEAFFQAVKDGDLAAVTAELDAGFNPNTPDPYGYTPLMVVEDPRVARRLLSAGANVNARTENNATPLIEAAGRCNPELVRLFLQSGADVRVRDLSEGDSALDEALLCYPPDEDSEEVVKILREAGAEERVR